jgi:hypothetical protein
MNNLQRDQTSLKRIEVGSVAICRGTLAGMGASILLVNL